MSASDEITKLIDSLNEMGYEIAAGDEATISLLKIVNIMAKEIETLKGESDGS